VATGRVGGEGRRKADNGEGDNTKVVGRSKGARPEEEEKGARLEEEEEGARLEEEEEGARPEEEEEGVKGREDPSPARLMATSISLLKTPGSMRLTMSFFLVGGSTYKIPKSPGREPSPGS
jgi:hypothetical protein